MADLGWWTVFVVSCLVALVVSALCSIAESVLLSLSTAQVVDIGRKNPKIGAIWENFKKDVNEPITSILAINTTAHTMGASFAGAAFEHLFDKGWVSLFAVIFTFLMLQYTEILPKSLGVRYNQTLAFWVARPLYWATLIGAPFIHLLRFFNKPFERNSTEDDTLATVKEITLLTSLARRRNFLDDEQERIIKGTLKLSATEVRDVMVPFEEVSTLSDDMTTTEALEIAHNDSHTRFPVYYGTNQNLIIGYVNFKELVTRRLDSSDATWNLNDDSTNLSKFVRSIIRVEPTDKASEVLNLLVRNHDHIALVIDSDQKDNLGILTLEDLVEELVGEIEDEFDRSPETLKEFPDMLRVGGGVSLDRLSDAAMRVFPGGREFHREIMEEKDQTKRLALWIEERLNVPVVRNSRVDVGELSIWVKRVRRGKVFDVVVLRK